MGGVEDGDVVGGRSCYVVVCGDGCVGGDVGRVNGERGGDGGVGERKRTKGVVDGGGCGVGEMSGCEFV